MWNSKNILIYSPFFGKVFPLFYCQFRRIVVIL